VRHTRAQARLLDQLDALLASIGPPAAAFGPTAAAMHPFDGFALSTPFHVVVPYARSPRRIGHVVHRTRFDVVPTVLVDGIRCTSPTLTLIHLAASHPAKEVTIALDGALRDRLTSETHLHETIVAMRARGREGPLAMLRLLEGAEVVRGGQSWLERRFLELVAESRLPRPDTQQVLARRGRHLVRVDCRFPDTPVVVELLGYRWHRSPADMTRDAERMNALVLAGYLVMQFTYSQVTESPASVITQVRAALAQ
jgi:very-short-patch-repair endonuclease